MFGSIWDDIKREYNHGNMITRIIIANIAFFVLIKIIWVILRLGNGWETPELYDTISHFFMFSSSLKHNLTHPWAIITNMFFHEGFFHIIWNMLFLYWFGRIVGDFIGDHRVLPLYLLAGIVGNLAFLLSTVLLPYGGDGTVYALGASGAVMGMVVAAGFISPDYLMHLILIGEVKLKYIVGVLLFIDLIGVAGDINTGGHFAHLGGAFFGWFFVYQLRNGKDLSEPVNSLFDKIKILFTSTKEESIKKGKVIPISKKQKNVRKKQAKPKDDNTKLSHQEHLDHILDKIKESGYDSLNDEEKEFLFKASKD